MIILNYIFIDKSNNTFKPINNHNENVHELIKSINISVDPCNNFYQHVCSGFISNAIIEKDKTSFEHFTNMRNLIDQQIDGIFLNKIFFLVLILEF